MFKTRAGSIYQQLKLEASGGARGGGKWPPNFSFAPPPKMVSICTNSLWLCAISNHGLSIDCYYQRFYAGFVMKRQKNRVKCIISGFLNHSLPRCSKICCQDESATGTTKTILPPQKIPLPSTCPPTFISSWCHHC